MIKEYSFWVEFPLYRNTELNPYEQLLWFFHPFCGLTTAITIHFCCMENKCQISLFFFHLHKRELLFSIELFLLPNLHSFILCSKQLERSGKGGLSLYLSSLQMLLLQLRRWLAAATLGGMGGLEGKQNSTATKSAAIIPTSASSQKYTTFIMQPWCQHQTSQRFYGFRLNLSLLIRKRA